VIWWLKPRLVFKEKSTSLAILWKSVWI